MLSKIISIPTQKHQIKKTSDLDLQSLVQRMDFSATEEPRGETHNPNVARGANSYDSQQRNMVENGYVSRR